MAETEYSYEEHRAAVKNAVQAVATTGQRDYYKGFGSYLGSYEAFRGITGVLLAIQHKESRELESTQFPADNMPLGVHHGGRAAISFYKKHGRAPRYPFSFIGITPEILEQ